MSALALPEECVASKVSKVPTSESDTSKTPVHLPHLPYDIFSLTIQALDNERASHHTPWFCTIIVLQPTLNAAYLSNRALRDASHKLLYKDVVLSSKKSLKALKRTLGRRRDSRPLIQSLHFSRAYYARDRHDSIEFKDYQMLDDVYSINSHSVKAQSSPSWARLLSDVIEDRMRDKHNQKIRKLNIETLTRLKLEMSANVQFIFDPASAFLPSRI